MTAIVPAPPEGVLAAPVPAGEAVLDDAGTEEAVVNALWFAEDVQGRGGRLVPAIRHAVVVDLLKACGRLDRTP